MGAVEDAVDAAADFIGAFVDKTSTADVRHGDNFKPNELVHQAVSHLQTINTADLAADPDAPYDASLAGVVYGLLDLITSLGVLPHLSPGVAFSQRPRSVLTFVFPVPPNRDEEQLAKVVETLMPILAQRGSGVQPLLSQRTLPDIISALAELSLSPASLRTHHTFVPVYQRTIEETPTSRLLPILTTFLQQPLPIWLRPLMSRDLAMIPLRQRGVRHTIEFLALSYLSKNSQVPQDASSLQSQVPIPLEAVTQASRLLVLPPTGMTQDEWLRQLAPQLWALLDGNEGPELSRAAGKIIAGGVLSRRATGAPDTIGWELFVLPLLQNIDPKTMGDSLPPPSSNGQVLIEEKDLDLTLGRLSAIALSYSHAGLLKRLIGPVLLPIWALLNYAQARPALNKRWALLSRSVLSQYMAVACDPKQIDDIAQNIFWDGGANWTLGPGSQGGVEIRERSVDNREFVSMNNILMRIGSLDSRVSLLVSLLLAAKIPDDIIGSIFLQATRRWLSPAQDTKASLTDNVEIDPLAALTDAKLSEAMATTFKDQFARSPQHILELMRQLLLGFVSEHQTKVKRLAEKKKWSRANLQDIVKKERKLELSGHSDGDTTDEDLISFAISILNTLVSSADLKQTPETKSTLASVIAPLVYLSQEQPQLPISPLITNSASTLLQLLQSASVPTQMRVIDPLAEHRATLKTVLADLISPEPPNRTWALKTLHKLLKDSTAFPVIDVPSLAHLLLSASLADPESYVHIAAVPVLVDLAARAPSRVVKILVDAFVDIDERSLNLGRRRWTEETGEDLRQALDFRLRVGEVLNNFVLDESSWRMQSDTTTQYSCQKQITEACLSLASRRGERTQTLSTRTQLAQAERKLQEEGEAAWGGPIPNLLDPNGENSQDQVERDALLKIVQGWEDTGIQEDVRVRASALSVLSTILEHRLGFLGQATVDAALQMVLLVLTVETSEAKGLLRRAAVLVVMGLLRGLDGALEGGEETTARLDMTQQEEVERAVKWVREEDVDALVRDHAASVLEGMETLRMKKLYRFKDEGWRLGADMGLEGSLRGLDVQPDLSESKEARRNLIVEEME